MSFDDFTMVIRGLCSGSDWGWDERGRGPRTVVRANHRGMIRNVLNGDAYPSRAVNLARFKRDQPHWAPGPDEPTTGSNPIKWAYPNGITKQRLRDHFQVCDPGGEVWRSLIVSGNGDSLAPETLVLIDVDSKVHQDVTQAFEFLRRIVAELGLEGVYSEPSAGGGAHGYFLLRKERLGTSPRGQDRFTPAHEVNEVLNGLQRRLRAVLASCQRRGDFVLVSDVEVRCTCTTARAGPRGRVERAEDVTCGRLGKLPLEAFRRQRDFLGMPRLPLEGLRSWIGRPSSGSTRPQVAITPGERHAPWGRGSTGGVPIPRQIVDRIGGDIRKLADKMVVDGPIPTSGRHVATAEDLAIYLTIVGWCSLNQGVDQAMPSRRIEVLWQMLHAAGHVSRPPCVKRMAAIRNFLDARGLIAWVDHGYTVGDRPRAGCAGRVGQCCRWSLAPALLDDLGLSQPARAQPHPEAGDAQDKDTKNAEKKRHSSLKPTET